MTLPSPAPERPYLAGDVPVGRNGMGLDGAGEDGELVHGCFKGEANELLAKGESRGRQTGRFWSDVRTS